MRLTLTDIGAESEGCLMLRWEWEWKRFSHEEKTRAHDGQRPLTGIARPLRMGTSTLMLRGRRGSEGASEGPTAGSLFSRGETDSDPDRS